MPDDDLPAPEPPPPEQPTLLGGVSPDEMFARGMQTVKMTSGATGGWQPPAVEECARLFPGYEVLKLLGRGGMGAVYQARQIELDRLVAIKLLPLEVSVDKDFADRFRREARAMAKLNHPNIISVYDFGTTKEGHLFFVMEYVEGANLADIIHQVGLAPDQSLSIAEQVCTALAYAHNKGIVHRDIKPANVMVDTESHVKVADFGLARLTDPGAEQLGHTMTGTVMGTPDYMAPEQCRGMNVDHRADIYSLGVMIYEMMCREVPKGIFDPPSQRTGCDTRIDGIVIKAMQQSPERRYQSTQEMRHDITTARTPLPAPPPPAGALPRKPRPVARPGVPAAPLPGGPIVGRRSSPPPAPAAKMAALQNPPAPPETSVMQAIKPPAPAKKSKLPLYGGIGVGVAALAVAAFLFLPKKEPLTKAEIDAREHAGPRSGDIPVAEGGRSTTATGMSPLLEKAAKDAPFVNTLGMKFVPVPGTKVLFSIWDTRVQDYAAYAGAKKVGDSWTKQEKDGVPVGREPNHPVVGVSWEDAQGFCQWLTEKESAEGKLTKGMKYRLPTDEEWSAAVGLPPELGGTPAEKSEKNSVDFPWGKEYPPRGKVGNYADENFHQKFPKPDAKDPKGTNQWIEGYTDGYATTSPVGSFPANAYGLYDMGGNVWQWCEDWFDPFHKDRVLRGASWSYGDRYHLLSSYRYHDAPTPRYYNVGFRCVLAPGGAADGGTRSVVSQTSPNAATPHLSPSDEPWVNAMDNAELRKNADPEGGSWRWRTGDFVPLSPVLKDGAVRMLFSFADSSRLDGCIVYVRNSGDSRTAAQTVYTLRLSSSRDHVSVRVKKAGNSGQVLKDFPTPGNHPLPASEPIELELRAMGSTLLAKINGTEVGRVEDSTLKEGLLAIRLESGAVLHAVEILDLSKSAAAPPPAATVPAAATKDAPFVNSLGMKFVPVPETKVLFNIWDTRVQDYAAYAKVNKVDDAWTKQEKDDVPVSREPDHPVVGVSWEDAQAFCQWLSHKETTEGRLPPGAKYRLPTDEEWSAAVGLPSEVGATPAEKSGKNSVDFPWGKEYPPRGKVGNYADETFHAKFPSMKNEKENHMGDAVWLEGYTDGNATTSPVGSFPANAYGLYDIGGNVWQWCEDWFDASHKDRVVRGASWSFGGRARLLSSNRYPSAPGYRSLNIGFRCVLAPADANDGGTHSGVSPSSLSTATPRLLPSSEPWVDAMDNGNLLKAAVKEGAALRMTAASKGAYIDLSPELKDGAVRMLFTADASVMSDCAVQVRRTPGFFYNLNIEPDFLHIGLGIVENGVGRRLKSFRLPVEAQRPAGQPTELELRAVGTTLIARANGFEAFRLDDSKLAQGHLAIRLAPGVLLHAVQTLDLSKGAAASSPAAPIANLNPAGWEKAVHLLPLIQPEKDAVGGVWKMVNGKLQSDMASNARLQIPYEPPEEYDYRLVFSYEETTQEMTGGQVQQLLVKKNHSFQWVMGAPHGNNSAFEMLAGASASSAANPTRKAADPVLARAVTHTSIVEVRNDGLKAWLDGELAAEWKTDYQDMTGNRSWKLLDDRALGVGSWHTAVRFEQIDVREVTGKGKLTRGPAPQAAPGPKTDSATKDAPFVNSLGMKFVPVPIIGGPTNGQPVLFSIWDTRVQDYEVFVKETKRQWPKVDFEQGPTHPAVMVSWEDAQAFCQWLNQREQAAGRLPTGWNYRLPSDHEWSCAAGIGDREDPAKLPVEKSQKINDVFPWGTPWPPPDKAGNYASEELQPLLAAGKYAWGKAVLPGYRDGFAETSPVGSFAANRFGLYDLGGNVWQWCEDWYEKEQKHRVLRGASWSNGDRQALLSSTRSVSLPGSNYYGFRCVLAPVASDGGTRSSVSPPPAEAGFRPLFDGKTLTGWRSYPSEDLPADWRVADGAILGGHRSYLVTKETFGDFELRLEWKVGSKGNGGIFFRMPPGEGNLPRTAPEFQLSAHDDPDKYKTGALYDVLMPSADVSLPEGQWNTARLVVQGNHVEHWVNDQLVLSYELQSDDWTKHWKAGPFANIAGYAPAAQGWIGLQGWVGEPAYRNIRIRPLTGGSAAAGSSN